MLKFKDISFGKIKFKGSLIGIYGGPGSGKTSVLNYLQSLIMKKSNMSSYTNNWNALQNDELVKSSKVYYFFDDENNKLSSRELHMIHNHCLRYNQRAFIFKNVSSTITSNNSYNTIVNKYNFDQIYKIENMILTTIINRFDSISKHDYQNFEFIKSSRSTFVSPGCCEAKPCEILQEKQFIINHKTACSECKGAKQILMLENFVPCKLCEQ